MVLTRGLECAQDPFYNQVMQVSQRLRGVPASPIRKLVPFAEQAKKEGVTVYHLNIGDPDIKTPEVMLQVLRTWEQNPIGYAQSKGDPEFIRSLITYYQSLGFCDLTEEDIQITLGGSEAIGMAFFATCNPGDEVLVFEPFYANYLAYAALYQVRLVAVPTEPQTGFHLPTQETIEKYITSHTKAILLCNPNNPTGTAYSQQELEMVLRITEEHSLYVLADEVYREFIYDEKDHISLLSFLTGAQERIILLDSLSKRYSLCGARLGVLVSKNKEVMNGVLRIAQGRLSAGLIDQRMAAALTKIPESYVKTVQQEYQARRNLLYQGLSAIPGVFVTKPEGAFYCIVTLPVEDADHFCQWLLTDFRDNQETIMLAPASGFYLTEGKGKDQVRIAYVLEQNKLQRSVALLAKALEVYRV